ncbi:unnamed protein product [Heligmosomoides polygyrus]|uniref:Helitron_like_N domain-containing protein n=1 Tax=Heligmosomoides polygyrus TaxID=6339 RepID=A0A3P8EYP8_HELPZ|nr:unnamed protein product [Heligmosomoides polygyrus]
MEVAQRPPFKPVRAQFVPSQQRGRDIAVYVFPDDHDLCYEWFYQLQMSDGLSLLYMCCGCKALKRRDRQTYSKPIPSCRILDGYFVSDPCNPRRPHYCEPRLTTKATARRLIIGKCNELRERAPDNRSAAHELNELLSKISSEEIGGFSAEERKTMVHQITNPSEYGRDNARRVIQRAQHKARQQVGRTGNIKRYMCIVCGQFREYPFGRRPPFHRHHVTILLAALIRFSDAEVNNAKNIYKTCKVNRKVMCKEHYLEAATALFSKMAASPRGARVKIDFNAFHVNEAMVDEGIVEQLNETSLSFEAEAKLTAKSVAFFLNDTIAYCVDKRDIKEGASSVVPVAELCGSESPNEYIVSQDAPGSQPTALAKTVDCGRTSPEKNLLTVLQKLCASNDESVDVQDMQTDADPISDDAVRSLLLFSQPPNSDYGPPPPPEPKKYSYTPRLPRKLQPLKDIPPTPWPERTFIVEGRQLLQLLRHCPGCGTDIESSGSSFKLSSETTTPIVDIFCKVCIQRNGESSQWRGRDDSLLAMRIKASPST